MRMLINPALVELVLVLPELEADLAEMEDTA
jgi:hypothetical protein